MPNPNADPAAVERLAALRGAPLTVLAAFAIAAADLVGAYWLCSITGYRQGTVGPTLANLAKMGFVESVERYTWRLTPFGQAIAPGLAAVLTHKKSESLPPTHQIQLPPTHINRDADSQQGTLKEPVIPEVRAVTHKKSESRPPSSSSVDISTNTNDQLSAQEKELRAQFATALRSAGIYHQMRGDLANELIEDNGPHWLRQALAWIAQATAEGMEPTKRGALIWPMLRDRREADDIYQPPDGLSFTAALAWAERGGRALDEGKTAAPGRSTLAPDDPITADDALQLAPGEIIWRAVLEQLHRETPPSVHGWLDNAALIETGPGLYQMITTSAQHAAWLSNRLKPRIEQAITAASRAPAAVTFTYPGKEEP